jgi:hypothetical protein
MRADRRIDRSAQPALEPGESSRASVKIKSQQKTPSALGRRYLSPIVNAGEAESRCLIDTDCRTGAMFQRKYTTS